MNPESFDARRRQPRTQRSEVSGLVVPRLDDERRLSTSDVQVGEREIRMRWERDPQQRDEPVHARRMHRALMNRDQFVAPHHPEPPAAGFVVACVQGHAIAIAETLVVARRTHGLQHVSPAFQDSLQVRLLLRDARGHGQRAMAAAAALGLAAGG